MKSTDIALACIKARLADYHGVIRVLMSSSPERKTHLSIPTANRLSLQCLLTDTGTRCCAAPLSSSRGSGNSPSKTVCAVCSPVCTPQRPNPAELTESNVSESWLKHRAVHNPELGARRLVGVPEESHECSDMNLSQATASQPLEGLDAMHNTEWESCGLDTQALDSVG